MTRQCRGRSTLLVFVLSLFAFVLGGCDFLVPADLSSSAEEETSYSSSAEGSHSSTESISTNGYDPWGEMRIEYDDRYDGPLYAGSTAYLRAYFRGGLVLASWESSDESVATVEEGTVFALKAGTVDILARYVDVDGLEYFAELEIEVRHKNGPIAAVSFTSYYYELKVGESLCLDDILVVAGDQEAARSYTVNESYGSDNDTPGEAYSFDPETLVLTGKKIGIVDVQCRVDRFFTSCSIVFNGEYSAGFEYEEKGHGTYEITRFDGYGKEIVVPDEWNGLPVSEVSCDFGSGIEKLTFGKNVISFTGSAPSLEEVNLEGLQVIGAGAFQDLKATTIELSPSLVSIGNYAFSYCDNLEKVIIPTSTREIGDTAFDDCPSLRYAYLPSSVLEVGYNAFSYPCRVLTDADARLSGWDPFYCYEPLAAFGVEAVVEDESGLFFAIFEDEVSPYAGVFDCVVEENIVEIPGEVDFDGGTCPVKAVLEDAFNSSVASTIKVPLSVDEIASYSLDTINLERVIIEGSLDRFEYVDGHPVVFAQGAVIYATGEAGSYSSAIEHFQGNFVIDESGVEYALINDGGNPSFAIATALRVDGTNSTSIKSHVEFDGVEFPVARVDIKVGWSYELILEDGIEIWESSNDCCDILNLPASIRGNSDSWFLKAVFSPVGPDVLEDTGIMPNLSYNRSSGTSFAHSYAGWHGVADGGLYSLYRASSGVIEAMFVRTLDDWPDDDLIFEIREQIEVDGVSYPVTALAYNCITNGEGIIVPSGISSSSEKELGLNGLVFSRGSLQSDSTAVIVENYVGPLFEADGYSLALCHDDEHGDYLTIYGTVERSGPVVDIPSSFSFDGREYPVGALVGPWSGPDRLLFSVPPSVFKIEQGYAFYGSNSRFLIEEGSTIDDASIDSAFPVHRHYLGRYAVNDGVLYGLFADGGEAKLAALYLLEDADSLVVPSDLELEGTSYPVSEITNYAFERVDVSSLHLPGSIERLPDDLFYSHPEMISFSYGEGGTHIGHSTFNGCSSLEEVSLPSTLKSIGSYAFSGCESLKELYVPEGVETIGVRAFEIASPECRIYLAAPKEKPGFERGWDITYGAVIVFGVEKGDYDE